MNEFQLGQRYRLIEKNETKAFENYKKSVEKGYDNVQIQLGSLYEKGEGTEKNLEKTFYWYN